jgi:hypothetical protein
VTGTVPVTIAAAVSSPEAASLVPGSPAVGVATATATAPASPPIATPVAYQSDAVTFGPIIWATAIDPETRAPREPATVIPPTASTIYATVAARQLTAGTMLTAQWSYNRTRLETFDQVLVSDETATDIWIEFHLVLTQPEAWPEGTYAISILVDDQPALTGNVEVRDPAS